jgi:hypothetical protein
MGSPPLLCNGARYAHGVTGISQFYFSRILCVVMRHSLQVQDYGVAQQKILSSGIAQKKFISAADNSGGKMSGIARVARHPLPPLRRKLLKRAGPNQRRLFAARNAADGPNFGALGQLVVVLG